MTTHTTWPNPERPGYPMFHEKTLRHVLKKKDSGEIIIRNWKSDGQHWDVQPTLREAIDAAMEAK